MVEGRREGGRVRQVVVRYLGPVSAVAYGVPGKRSKGLDPKKVNEAIVKMPVALEELVEARQSRLPAVIAGKRRGFLSSGTRERVEGEAEALATVAASKFQTLFVEVGKGRYRMR